MSGNRVSHANNKNKRVFRPNLHKKRYWLAALPLSAGGIRTMCRISGLRARGTFARTHPCVVRGTGHLYIASKYHRRCEAENIPGRTKPFPSEAKIPKRARFNAAGSKTKQVFSFSFPANRQRSWHLCHRLFNLRLCRWRVCVTVVFFHFHHPD